MIRSRCHFSNCFQGSRKLDFPDRIRAFVVLESRKSWEYFLESDQNFWASIGSKRARLSDGTFLRSDILRRALSFLGELNPKLFRNRLSTQWLGQSSNEVELEDTGTVFLYLPIPVPLAYLQVCTHVCRLVYDWKVSCDPGRSLPYNDGSIDRRCCVGI